MIDNSALLVIGSDGCMGKLDINPILPRLWLWRQYQQNSSARTWVIMALLLYRGRKFDMVAIFILVGQSQHLTASCKLSKVYLDVYLQSFYFTVAEQWIMTWYGNSYILTTM